MTTLWKTSVLVVPDASLRLNVAGAVAPDTLMLSEKGKLWLSPPGSVCLMMVTVPQLLIVLWLISRSCGFEVKLAPDERDSHVCCGKLKHWPLRFSAWERLIPNSENWLTGSATPLIPLAAAVIGVWFDLPLNCVPLGMITFAPQQGSASDLTKHVPAFPPAVGLLLSIQVSKWKLSCVPPLRKS